MVDKNDIPVKDLQSLEQASLNSKDGRPVPEPVRMAQCALAELPPSRADKLRKPLCALAMTLSRAGRQVTVDILRQKLAEGDAAVIAPRALFNAASEIHGVRGQPSLLERYEAIAGKVRIATAPPPPLPEHPSLGPGYNLERAIESGNVARVREWLELNASSRNIAMAAAQRPNIEIIDLLIEKLPEKGDARTTFISDLMVEFASAGNLPMLEYCIGKKEYNPDKAGMALVLAAADGNFDCVRRLVDSGVSVHTSNSESWKFAYNFNHYNITHFLMGKGADFSAMVDGDDMSAIAEVNKNIDRWLKDKGRYPPCGLEKLNPPEFDGELEAVIEVSALLKKEGCDERSANLYAALALAFFETADGLMEYFARWACPARQPLHDVIYMMAPQSLDKKGNPLRDTASWRAAMMECGPEMARLTAFAGLLARPEKTDDGKRWSIARTRQAAARVAYVRACENTQLAELFFRHDMNEESFDDALSLVTAYRKKEKSRIPEITIDGKYFDMPKAIFRKLPEGDYRGLVLGQITDCCQSIGGAGESCAKHGFSSENGGFYVVAVNDNKKDDDIIGQSWVWRGTQGELVFDSLETLGCRLSSGQWGALMAAFAGAIDKTQAQHDITAVHIGAGGDTPGDMGFAPALVAAQPLGYSGYRDSQHQFQTWVRKP